MKSNKKIKIIAVAGGALAISLIVTASLASTFTSSDHSEDISEKVVSGASAVSSDSASADIGVSRDSDIGVSSDSANSASSDSDGGSYNGDLSIFGGNDLDSLLGGDNNPDAPHEGDNDFSDIFDSLFVGTELS